MTDTNGDAAELGAAIEELEASLRRASEAAARIKAALPRFERMNAAFEELESIIEAGRRAAAVSAPSRPAPAVPDAPSAVIPRPARPKQPAWEPPPDENTTPNVLRDSTVLAPDIETITEDGTDGDALTSFRLEFESDPGPLDLRAVDDAISEHPAVRDVTLLDYDGRRATLKVWIAATASAAEVQQMLSERAGKIAPEGSDVSIVALEDVA